MSCAIYGGNCQLVCHLNQLYPLPLPLPHPQLKRVFEKGWKLMFGSKKINTKNCLFILSPSAFLLYFLYCALLRMVSVHLTYFNYWSCANMNLVVVSQGRVLFEAKIIIKTIPVIKYYQHFRATLLHQALCS